MSKVALGTVSEPSKCRFCLSDIPSGAAKCRHCREWQNIPDDAMEQLFGEPSGGAAQARSSLPGSPGLPELPPASFQSRLAALVPIVSYWTFYFVLSMSFYAAVALVWTFNTEDRIFLVSFGFNAMQMFFSSAGIVWFEKLLDRFRGEIPSITGWSHERSEEYYLANRSKVFAPKLPLLVGFIVCTIAVIGDSQIIGTPFVSDGGRLTFLVYEFGFLFWSASAIVYFIKLAVFIREFGDLDLRILVIQEEEAGIRMLGKFILQTALFAIMPFISSILARHIGGWNFSSLLSLWFSLFGVAILFYLFWPIYNIHRAMVREKDCKLNLISRELNSLLSLPRLERENIMKVRNLLEIRNYLQDTNTWPFDMNTVIGLLTAVIVPLASILLDRTFKGG